jgi:nitrile hydratase subunit beta
MNGAHDLGGMHGFGPVVAEPDEPVFHADWERRAFGLTLAMGAWRRWNLDMSRSMREQTAPVAYLAMSYYELWLSGLERLLVKHGLVQPEELARARHAEASSAPAPAPAGAPPRIQEGALRAETVPRVVRNRRAARLDDPVPPAFQVGDAVRARNLHPRGHTRLPRYVRGRRGEITIDHGVFIFPDTHAAGEGTKPQHVYAVKFTARELWGPDASARDTVYVDLWDDYLEPAR